MYIVKLYRTRCSNHLNRITKEKFLKKALNYKPEEQEQGEGLRKGQERLSKSIKGREKRRRI